MFNMPTFGQVHQQQNPFMGGGLGTQGVKMPTPQKTLNAYSQWQQQNPVQATQPKPPTQGPPFQMPRPTGAPANSYTARAAANPNGQINMSAGMPFTGLQHNYQAQPQQQQPQQSAQAPPPQQTNAPGMLNVQQMQPMSNVFSPQQTSEAVGRGMAQFGGTTIPMLMQQNQRAGIRADSMIPHILPQYAQAQAGQQMAQQMIPFQHAQMNAQNNLANQNTQWQEALGFGNQALNAQNQLNQFQLGNQNSLADFFRMFLT